MKTNFYKTNKYLNLPVMSTNCEMAQKSYLGETAQRNVQPRFQFKTAMPNQN